MRRLFVLLTVSVLGTWACRSTSNEGKASQDAGSQTNTPRVGFIAVGDTGRANPEQIKVAAAMKSWCSAHLCDFVVMLGDNFYPSGVASTSDSQWQSAFETIYQGLDMPFYAVLGNHDYGNNGLGTDFARAQYQVAYTQISSKWKMPENRYHFTYGGLVELFAADTNLSMFAKDEEVRNDFKGWTAASTAPWKIAMGHHPYLSNGPHGNAGTYEGIPTLGAGVKSFLDGFVCGKVDVYLAGHDHNRQWLSPTCNGTELVVSGAGSAAVPVTERNAAYFSKGTLGFVYFLAEPETLTGTFVDEEGAAEFTRTLSK